MQTTDVDLDTELRAWAKGLLGLEAATELLIRAGYAGARRSWVKEADGRHWIDFEAIPDLAGGMSGGEQRYLRIAASLGADVPVILADELAGLDHDRTILVLTAMAHAAGFIEQTRGIEHETDGTARLTWLPALASWPSNRPSSL